MADEDDEAIVDLYGKRMKLVTSRTEDEKTGKESSDCFEKVQFVKSLDYLHLYFDAKIKSKPAVIFDNGKGRAEDISYEKLDTLANSVKEILEKSLGESQFIGVMCGLGTLYPVLILGILRSGKAFFNIDFDNSEDGIKDGVKYLNLKYIICECHYERKFDMKGINRVLEWNFPKSNLKCSIYEVISNLQNPNFHAISSATPEIAYAIQTSGTSGQRKMVLVPHSCICPNIQSFIHVNWNVNHEDIIFGAAPPTFDPHVVELFAALGTSATIIYSTAEVKSDSRLVNLLMKYCVTILQVTPSIFRRMSPYLEKGICLQTLRIVAFGGEKCLTKQELGEVLKTTCFHPNIRFQNVYGVTEVSCWASVCDIDLQNNDPITVGQGILETEIHVARAESEDDGEIIISSPTRYCHIIDPLTPNENSLSGAEQMKSYEHRTGDIGGVTKYGIEFEGREDRVVKRNGMKVSLFEIEEMTYSTGLVAYAECRLYFGKIYLLVKLKPQFDALHNSSCSSASTSSVSIVPFLSSKLELPLFMYPDALISMKWIPLNSNGKIDFPHIINSVLTKDSNSIFDKNRVSFQVSREKIVKTVIPVWKSCTWPGERSLEKLQTESFYEVGGTSISAARFVESVFMALKLFGSQVHQMHEKELLLLLVEKTFTSVVNILFNIICTEAPITANESNLDFELLSETQDTLSYPIIHSTETELSSKSTSDYEMLDETMMNEDSPVFNNVDTIQIEPSHIELPLQLVNMFDFNLGLCVDASPAVTNRKGCAKDRAVIGCHGGVLLCVDLHVLRGNLKSSNLAIAWKRRMPSRIEAEVTLDEDGLYGYIGCHDCNFYKFSVVSGSIICSTLCHAPIRSKADLCAENEVVIFVDSANCIYGLNSNDLNIKWTLRSFRLLATVTPLIVGNICYVTTLNKGLIALEVRTGNTIWDCDTINHSYSNPTLGHKIFHTAKKQKRKPAIIVGTKDSSHVGFEIRDVKTGCIKNQYKSASQSSVSVNCPLYSKCCDRIIWISSDSLLIFNSAEKESIYQYDYDCGLPLQYSNIASSVIACFNKINQSRECVLFYKIPGKTGLAFVCLHDGTMHEINAWFLKQDFESFSKPNTSGEFILFGGRDNKLHIIKCHIP